MTIYQPPTDPDPVEAFTRRLRHLSLADPSLLSAARRWTPGTVDPRMVAITRDAVTPEEVAAFPLVAVAYAEHTPHGVARRGVGGANIGRQLRRRGGTNDPASVRALDRLVTATTATDLHAALRAAAVLIKGQPSPDWDLTAREVTDWMAPATRDRARLAWARGFYAYPSSTTTSTT